MAGEACPQTLVELIVRLSMARGIDEIMAVARTGARRLMGADGVTFVLRDDGKCFYADEDAIAPLWKGQRFPMTSCISGWAMLNRQPAVIEDIYADPRIPHDAYRRTFVKSLVMVPVRQDDPMAAIGAYWAERRQPRPDEVELLMTIANSAAVALTNVSLISSLVAAREEAVQANKAKSRFLANMSHELRTPLNAIMGFAEMMEVSRLPPNAPQYDEYLGYIRDSGAHLLDLVSDLLDMSRIEEGRFPIQVEPEPLVSMLDELVQRVAAAAAHKGVELRRGPADAALGVLADRRATKQILLNVLSNAVKFTPPGGTVEIGIDAQGPMARIHVRDTGIGMSEADLARVDEPFVQPARERGGTQEGMGLGLSIARSLAELQGGSLAIASREGAGTTVTLSLKQA